MPTINTPVEDLPAAASVTGSEKLYADDGSADVYITPSQIKDYISSEPEERIDSSFTLQNAGDATKQAKFDAGSIATGTTRTFTLPDANTVLVGADVAQTVQNKTLDNSNIVTLRDDRFTLQDSGDTTKQLVFQLSGITTATIRTVTWPDANITVVGLDTTQTLTNKTLGNSNVFTARTDRWTLQDASDTTKQLVHDISGITTTTTRTVTWPNVSMTVVGLNSTQTLTNKTISGASNTLSNIAISSITEYATSTFTPTVTLVGGAGNTTPVYSTNLGRYTRIGNRVWVDVFLDGDGGAEGAGTGVINIALPFTSGASALSGVYPGGAAANGSNEYVLYVQPGAGNSTVALIYADAATNRVSFTGNLQNDTTRSIRLNFNYEI